MSLRSYRKLRPMLPQVSFTLLSKNSKNGRNSKLRLAVTIFLSSHFEIENMSHKIYQPYKIVDLHFVKSW